MSLMLVPRCAAPSRIFLTTLSLLALAGCDRPYNRPALEEPRPRDMTARPTAPFPGIEALMTGASLQVFWTHGMCTHDRDWAINRANLVARAMDAEHPIFSDEAVAVPKRQPRDEDAFKVKATIRSAKGTTDITYLIWSPMTKQYKGMVTFDNSTDDNPPGENPYIRAKLNGDLKKGLMNDCLVDAVVYAGTNGDRIRKAMQNALCDALAGKFTNTQSCDLSSVNDNRPLIFVTESLGSKFLFDAIRDLWQEQSAAGKEALIQRLQSLRMLFMAANQIPLLDPANPVLPIAEAAPSAAAPPAPTNSLANTVNIIRSAKRAPRRSSPPPPGLPPQSIPAPLAALADSWAVVAFTDPNDLLSYRLLPRFVGRADDKEREADEPRLINIIVSNDDTILGYVERPDNAHCGYRWNPYVIGLMVKGFDPNQPLPAVNMSAASTECF